MGERSSIEWTDSTLPARAPQGDHQQVRTVLATAWEATPC